MKGSKGCSPDRAASIVRLLLDNSGGVLSQAIRNPKIEFKVEPPRLKIPDDVGLSKGTPRSKWREIKDFIASSNLEVRFLIEEVYKVFGIRISRSLIYKTWETRKVEP